MYIPFIENINCEYSFDPSQWRSSNEYPKSVIEIIKNTIKNKKNDIQRTMTDNIIVHKYVVYRNSGIDSHPVTIKISKYPPL